MIKNILESFLIKIYSNLGNGELKFAFIQFSTMGIIGLLGVVIFYYLVGTSSMGEAFIVGAAYGRLLFDYLVEKYDKNYPYDKQYTPFLRFIATSAIVFVTIGGTFMLIKDAYENNTDVQKLIAKEYNHSQIKEDDSKLKSFFDKIHIIPLK